MSQTLKNDLTRKHQAKKAHMLKLNIQYFSENKTAELLKDIKEATDQFSKALDKQQEEIKNFGSTSDKTANEVKELEKKYTDLQEELKKMNDNMTDMAKKFGRPGYENQEPEVKSIGASFIESDEYKNRPRHGRIETGAMAVKSFFQKDLTSAAGSAGTLITPTRYNEIIRPQDRQFRLRDLLNAQPTDSNAIEFIRETGFTNNAAPVAEGGLKPQSDLTFAKQSESVKVIAHWIPATRQVIDDARQLRAYIDNRLLYGLELEEESQILYGDGTGENLQGLMTETGIQVMPGVAAGDTKIDHIRRSFTRSLLAGYPTTGVVLHPNDWEDIELAKGSDGHYIWINVNQGGQTRLFQVPVVQTPAIVENEFLSGAFGLGAMLWDREDANVRVSESHADYFARNMVAILAEERIAQTIFRPEAFVRGTFTAAV